jgi:hypothetical protein
MTFSIMLGLTGMISSGCYDGEQLVELARSEAIRTRLEEIDLGTYRTTVPRDPETALVAELEFRIFANAPRYRIPAIKEALAEHGFRLRYETLAAVRQATPEELAEPNLVELRRRISDVTGNVLKDTGIQSIGFADLRLLQQ